MSIATTLSKIRVNYLAKFILLLALAIGAPVLGIHSQWITGSIVNMVLILSVFLVGVRGAVLIGLLPSTIALGTGLLPAALAPMLPFIIISNIILVLVFSIVGSLSRARSESDEPRDLDGLHTNLHKYEHKFTQTHDDLTPALSLLRRGGQKYWLSLLLAAGLKFLFLFLTSSVVIKLLLNQKLAASVAQMMSWPQFYTALVGGFLTFGILKILKK